MHKLRAMDLTIQVLSGVTVFPNLRIRRKGKFSTYSINHTVVIFSYHKPEAVQK